MITVPDAIPVKVPPASMVPIARVPLDQIPPPVGSVKVSGTPMQVCGCASIGNGGATTVNGKVVAQEPNV